MPATPRSVGFMMSLPPFAVTYDYRCPFARNIHEHLVAGLQAGSGWDVTFAPFSLSQVHVEEGGTSVWDDPGKASGLLATEASIVVRDRHPEHFGAVHVALFAARHDEGRDLREREVVRDILDVGGVDGTKVLAEVDDGWPRDVFRKEHDAAVDGHRVFGVPTFVVGDDAVFVRVMTRPEGDSDLARRTIEQVVELLVGHPDLNEFKHTSISR